MIPSGTSETDFLTGRTDFHVSWHCAFSVYRAFAPKIFPKKEVFI